MPAQKFSRVAINYQGQHRSAVASCPDPTQISSPALVWPCGYPRQGLHRGAETNGTLLDLATFDLEDPLHRVLVKPGQASHREIVEGLFFQDHLANGFGKALLHLGLRLHRLLVSATPGNPKPHAYLADSHIETVLFEFLTDGLDYLSSSPNRNANYFLARNSSMASP